MAATTNAPIAYRDLIEIHRNSKPAGSTQPAYDELLIEKLPTEVKQVSGGEVVRGKTVEAITTFVVSLRYIPQILITQECRVTVKTGLHAGKYLYIHRVHDENMHNRPVRLQLHCKTNK